MRGAILPLPVRLYRVVLSYMKHTLNFTLFLSLVRLILSVTILSSVNELLLVHFQSSDRFSLNLTHSPFIILVVPCVKLWLLEFITKINLLRVLNGFRV